MAHTAELIAVGTELLLGNISNTDAQMLSEGLSELGVNVYFHTVVGDNPQRLRQAVEIARSRADIIITTGGLGPTVDDLTKQTLAECFGRKLIYHEDIGQGIRDWFARVGTPMTDNNLRQAYLPEGCTVFRNSWGTAPGCAFTDGGVTVLMLPGPPSECSQMFRHCAFDYLAGLSDGALVSRNIRIFGMNESAVEDKLHEMMDTMQNPTVAPYAKEGEVLVRVTAKGESPEEARALLEPVVEDIRSQLGGFIYGEDVESMEQALLLELKSAGKTLALAESCTGGLLAKRLTDIPGASECFLGGVVSYSSACKSALLGVPAELIESEGVVSQPVAEAMAEGARAKIGANFGVGITGNAGPDPENVQTGLVYVALASESGTSCRELRLGLSRGRIRTVACNHAMDMLLRSLRGLPAEEPVK